MRGFKWNVRCVLNTFFSNSPLFHAFYFFFSLSDVHSSNKKHVCNCSWITFGVCLWHHAFCFAALFFVDSFVQISRHAAFASLQTQTVLNWKTRSPFFCVWSFISFSYLHLLYLSLPHYTKWLIKFRVPAHSKEQGSRVQRQIPAELLHENYWEMNEIIFHSSI